MQWGECTKERILSLFTEAAPSAASDVDGPAGGGGGGGGGGGATRRIVTDTTKDRLLCYMCVVLMHLFDMSVRHEIVAGFAAELKLSEVKSVDGAGAAAPLPLSVPRLCAPHVTDRQCAMPLRCAVDRLSEYFREIGAVNKGRDAARQWVLTAPLQLQLFRRKGKGRGRGR
jgi:hypothetical protein